MLYLLLPLIFLLKLQLYRHTTIDLAITSRPSFDHSDIVIRARTYRAYFYATCGVPFFDFVLFNYCIVFSMDFILFLLTLPQMKPIYLGV